MDELVRVCPVLREARDAEGDRGADRLARRLHLEAPVGNCPPDALGDLERLLRRGLGQEDGELLPTEPCGHVVVPQLLAEDLCDPFENGVAGEMAVRVVDVPEEIEVGHDDRHRPVHPPRARELLAELYGEVAGVEEAGFRIDARLLLEGGNAQRSVDQEERGDGGRKEPWVPRPDGGERDAERCEDEVRREALGRE